MTFSQLSQRLWLLRGLILALLVLTPFVWMGWRFVQAAHKFGHLYEVNERLGDAAWQEQTAGSIGMRDSFRHRIAHYTYLTSDVADKIAILSAT